MNRILKSKKTREDLNADAKSFGDRPTRRWGRKKQGVEPKPELDLTRALPSSDEFRTSLLMPAFSARFSMLREQDDPQSLLGKASDDSVLTSNQRSGFAFGSLGDIAEVSSIKEGHPTFAPGGSSASVQTDDYNTDDESMYNGSMMSRARPGEGNMLFGGRQKIYKIPIGDAGAVNNMGSNESRGMRGRALYEDDVSMSAFQKLRAKERQEERERKLAELEKEMDLDGLAKDGMNSPSLANYDERRETTSSTNSGPASMMSTSTAPTSVVSQGTSAVSSPSSAYPPTPNLPLSAPSGLQRSNSRRLYDKELEQHMSEQQTAALTRINSIQRKNSARERKASPLLSQSKSTGNLHERYEQEQSSASSRAPSPLPSAPAEKLTTFDTVKGSNPSSGATSPVPFTFGPQSGEAENALTQSLAINDRGKATALGTFNRPKQFDEAQYLVRQRSLHQQRTESRARRPMGGSPVKAGQRRPSGEDRLLSSARPSLEQQTRARAGTARSDRSWSASSGARAAAIGMALGHPPVAQTHMEASTKKQNPAAQARAQLRPTQDFSRPPSVETYDDEHHEGSPLDQDVPSPKISFERGSTADVPPPLRQAPPKLHDHPAMRSETPPRAEKERKTTLHSDAPMVLSPPKYPPPTQGLPELPSSAKNEAGGIGVARSTNQDVLGGLVRQHLRQISNVSSVYPNEDAGRPPTAEFNAPVPSMYSQQVNPWDMEGFAAAGRSDRDSDSNATQKGRTGPNGIFLPVVNPTTSDAAQWMADLRKQHARDASTETQHEREAFADELMMRQKAIQENLKVKSEGNSRSQSPAAPGASTLKPFGILRQKSSRENVQKQQQEPPSKAMKMLGLSAGHQSAAPIPNVDKRFPLSEGPRQKARGLPTSPMGRTLHSRMPAAATEENSPSPLSEMSRPRKDSSTTERSNQSRRTPPDSSRTSGSRDGPSSSTSSTREPSSDMHRRDFPSQYPSTNSSSNPSARPSLETTGRLRNNSATVRPAMPNLRTQTAPIRPPALGAARSDSPASVGDPRLNHSADSSPVRAANAVFSPPAFAPQVSTPPPLSPPGTQLLGQTNTSLSQTPYAHHPVQQPQHLPASAYSLGPRPANQRPGPPHHLSSDNTRTGRFHRNPTVTKNHISEPKLISSTSTFDNTVDLPIPPHHQLNGAAGASARTMSPSPPAPTVNPLRKGFMRPFAGRRGDRSGAASPSPSGDTRTSSASDESHAHSSEGRKGSFASLGLGGGGGGRKPEEESEDDYMARPHGGRLRIRKVSESAGPGSGGGKRHEAVSAAVVEGGEGALGEVGLGEGAGAGAGARREETVAGGMF